MALSSTSPAPTASSKGFPGRGCCTSSGGVISLVAGFYLSPIKYVLVLSLILIVVIAAFLWTNAANDWFNARGFMLKRERERA